MSITVFKTTTRQSSNLKQRPRSSPTMADTVQDSILDILKASSADLFDELVSLTNESPEELLAKVAKANKDEKLKVETSRHHEAFADLCLEILLLGVREVSGDMLMRHHVEQDSPYLMLLSKYDYGGDIGFYYVCPERHQIDYFASHGIIKYLASQTISENQKKGVLLALTSNPCMRKVVELTFELIAADPQLEGYLPDILRATLILQNPKGDNATDEITKRLFGLQKRVKEMELSNLLTGNMQESEVQLIEDIWGEIKAAFNEHTEDLQEAGWFVDLHLSDYGFTFGADGCSSEHTIRDSPVLGHILRCLELLDTDTRGALCRTTIHRLLPSYSQLGEDAFAGAYIVGHHSWGFFLSISQHFYLQTVYPEDMPAALEEQYFDDYQAINLDLRYLKVHEESHAENLKWALKRCWEFLNQHCSGSLKSALKGLTVRVNDDTLLQDLINHLSLADEKCDFIITFKGGLIYLKELKDCLSRRKRLRFQRITVEIPNELNKGFVQRGLCKWYPYALKCVEVLYESEKSSSVKSPPSKNLLGGLRNGSSSPLREDLPDDVEFEVNGLDLREEVCKGRFHVEPRKKLAFSTIQEPKRSLEESFNSAQGTTRSIMLDGHGVGPQIGQGYEGPKAETHAGIVKPPRLDDGLDLREEVCKGRFHVEPRKKLASSTIQEPKRSLDESLNAAQGTTRSIMLDDSDDFNDFDDAEDLVSQMGTGKKIRLARSIPQGPSFDLDTDDETDSSGGEIIWVQSGADHSIDIQSFSKSIDQVAKALSTIGDECKLTQNQAQMTDSLTGQELIRHIGNGLRKVGDGLWKKVLRCQNTGVRFRYTATVAFLTWGFLSTCMHLDIVPRLVFNGKLTHFHPR